MTILRYTSEVQKQLGSKTKPEPWLHVVLAGNMFAIYVWDTRHVVEDGAINVSTAVTIQGKHVIDNHANLVGGTYLTKRINVIMHATEVKDN